MKHAFCALIIVAGAAMTMAQSGPYRADLRRQCTGVSPGCAGGQHDQRLRWLGRLFRRNHRGRLRLERHASAISAAGDYNLATSAAAVNMTQAERIKSRITWTRRTRSSKCVPSINRRGRPSVDPIPPWTNWCGRRGWAFPNHFRASEFDPVSGRLFWPELLQTDPYAVAHGEIDEMFAKRRRCRWAGLLRPDGNPRFRQGRHDGVEIADPRRSPTILCGVERLPEKPGLCGVQFPLGVSSIVSHTEFQHAQ